MSQWSSWNLDLHRLKHFLEWGLILSFFMWWWPSWNLDLHRKCFHFVMGYQKIIHIQFWFNHLCGSKEMFFIYFPIESYAKLCTMVTTIVDFLSTQISHFVKNQSRIIHIKLNFKPLCSFRTTELWRSSNQSALMVIVTQITNSDEVHHKNIPVRFASIWSNSLREDDNEWQWQTQRNDSSSYGYFGSWELSSTSTEIIKIVIKRYVFAKFKTYFQQQ